MLAIRRYVDDTIGPYFTASLPFEWEGAYSDSVVCMMPLIFILSPGADPTDYLLQLAEAKGKQRLADHTFRPRSGTHCGERSNRYGTEIGGLGLPTELSPGSILVGKTRNDSRGNAERPRCSQRRISTLADIHAIPGVSCSCASEWHEGHQRTA